jgi:thiosulfate/3-mercaptopyruvate sulfurtransferase
MSDERSKSRWLLSTDWLAQRLGAPDVVVVDGSSYLPTMQRDAAAEYLAGHIPGAVRFDIDAIADHSNPLPHMLPDAAQFARDVGALGIAETDTIVVYDGAGMYSAPRVWWTFRLFGAEKVFVLEGGLPKWKAEGRPLEGGAAKRAPRTFKARKNADLVASLATVRAALASSSAQVVDARPAERFLGRAPEPRPGLRSGHMPGALNVPSTSVVENGTLAALEKLRQAFAAGGVDLDAPVMRLGPDGRNPLVRARRAGQAAPGALRRFMVGMGIAQRSSDREGLSDAPSTQRPQP